MTRSWLSLLALGAVAVDHVVATAEPRVVRMPLTKVASREPPLSKRATSPQSVTLTNAALFYLYYVNATVGTPPQDLLLQIDTGSSDVWMFGPQVCNSQEGQQLCSSGYFDPSQSSSYNQVGPDGAFEIQYVTPGSGVVGNYFTDDFDLGPVKLTNLTMAVATKADAVNTGIMGIGYDTDESSVQNEGTTYPNIIDVMKSEGIIASKSYSLYLDDREAATGSVLFGGYDTAKYSDPLTVLDIQVDSQTGVKDSFSVVWSYLGVSTGSGSTTLLNSDFPYAAVLDSGTSLTVIPEDLFNELASYFNATNGGDQYGWLVPCSNANMVGALDFGFGGSNGATIQVPFSELALPTGDNAQDSLTFPDGTEACSFGLDIAGNNSPILLGDTFLRSAYVIYDIEANQVAIAQANYNSTASNVKEIPSGSDLASILGSAATAATGASATQTATSVIAPGDSPNQATSAAGHVTLSRSGSGSGTLSGSQTTISLHTTVFAATGTNVAGGAATTSSTKGAAPAGPVPPVMGLLSVVATATALFVGAAGMMLFF